MPHKQGSARTKEDAPLTLRLADAADARQASELLSETYLDGQLASDPEALGQALQPDALSQRGQLWVATARGTVVGAVCYVPPQHPALRIARQREAELHLLAVTSHERCQGVGAALTQKVQQLARADAAAVVLFTQERMVAAQRLYERAGFVRQPQRDFVADTGTSFRVYRWATHDTDANENL